MTYGAQAGRTVNQLEEAHFAALKGTRIVGALHTAQQLMGHLLQLAAAGLALLRGAATIPPATRTQPTAPLTWGKASSASSSSSTASQARAPPGRGGPPSGSSHWRQTAAS